MCACVLVGVHVCVCVCVCVCARARARWGCRSVEYLWCRLATFDSSVLSLKIIYCKNEKLCNEDEYYDEDKCCNEAGSYNK